MSKVKANRVLRINVFPTTAIAEEAAIAEAAASGDRILSDVRLVVYPTSAEAKRFDEFDPDSSFRITEDGILLLTESGDVLITE